jgi:hypothetical protein
VLGVSHSGLPVDVKDGRVFQELMSVDAREQVRNRFFGFVAHVGKAEGLTPDFAVTRVDDEVVSFTKFPCKCENIDAFVVLHAGERFRSKSFLSEKVEAGAANPIVHERVCARVPIKARVEAFVEDFVEF